MNSVVFIKEKSLLLGSFFAKERSSLCSTAADYLYYKDDIQSKRSESHLMSMHKLESELSLSGFISVFLLLLFKAAFLQLSLHNSGEEGEKYSSLRSE